MSDSRFPIPRWVRNTGIFGSIAMIVIGLIMMREERRGSVLFPPTGYTPRDPAAPRQTTPEAVTEAGPSFMDILKGLVTKFSGEK